MGLAYALDRALDAPKGRPLVHNLALSFVMLPVTGILLTIAIALPIVLSIAFRIAGFHDPLRLTHILIYLLSIALVFIVAVVLYRWLPNRTVSWAFAVRGASVVAIAWPAVQYAFAQYLTHVNFTLVYGALSAPLVLLLWFYCMGSIFLFGAEYSIAWPTGHSDPLPEAVGARCLRDVSRAPAASEWLALSCARLLATAAALAPSARRRSLPVAHADPPAGLEQLPIVLVYPFDVQTGADPRIGIAIAQILGQEMVAAGGINVLPIPARR